MQEKKHPEDTDVEQVGDESASGVQVRSWIVHFGKDCIKSQFFKGCLDNVTHECYHSHLYM